MTSNVFDNVNFLKVFPHGQKGWKQKSLIIVHHCPAIKYFLVSSWWKFLEKKESERRKIIWEETKYNLCLVLPNQVMRLHGKNLIIATYSRVRVSIWRRSCADELPTVLLLALKQSSKKKSSNRVASLLCWWTTLAPLPAGSSLSQLEKLSSRFSFCKHVRPFLQIYNQM